MFPHPPWTLQEVTGVKSQEVTSKTHQNLHNSALHKVILVYGLLSN